jgi:hypothetical protein
MNTSKQERQAICLPKFTSTKKATSPLRFPQREGYHEEPLASLIHHQGKLVLTKKNSTKEGQYKRSRVLHAERALNGRRLMLTVKIRQPSHEFTFGVGMSFIPYPLVLTPVV